MNNVRDFSLCNVLVILPAPEGSGRAAACSSNSPFDTFTGFPLGVLTEAGFSLMSVMGAIDGIGFIRASLNSALRVGIAFVDQAVFPGFPRRDIARMLKTIDPELEVAFISDESMPDSDELFSVLQRPLRGAEALRVALTLGSRWHSRNGHEDERSLRESIAVEVAREELSFPPVPKAPARYNVAPALLLIAVMIIVPMVCGWFGGRSEPSIFTGNVLTGAQVRSELPWSVLGKTRYAEVNSEWLVWYYDQFRTELSSGAYGIVHWDRNFTCTSFASRFASSAQIHYFAQSFQREQPAESIAVGEFWYKPDGGSEGHALVAACTEKGLMFMDPQTGHFVTLTVAEQRSAYLRKFD